MLQLQRLAGNQSVNALLGERAPSSTGTVVQRASRPAGIQRLSSDLQVRGKFGNASSHPKQVFFDFNSAAVDSKERAKIDDFLGTSPPPAVVVAVASEEGGDAANRPLAQSRGAAVGAIIGRRGPRLRVEVALAASVDNPDYRFMRRVDLAPPSSAKDDECILDPGCDARLVTAMGLAQALARIGHSAAANPHPPIRLALNDVFHASDDETATAVAEAYDNIVKELGVLTAPDRHSCQTPCTNAICRSGNRAFFDPKTNTMVACPDLKDTDKSVVETVLHEAVHGSPEIQGKDFARLAEPLFPFLTTAAALKNPDSYVEFTRVVTTGRRTPPRAPTGDFDTSMTAEQRAAVGKAVAWAIRRLLEAEETADFVYFALTAGHKNPKEAGQIDDVANERTVLKREQFGTTLPPAAPKAQDQWIVEGVSNRLHKLVLAAGSKPTVAPGSAITWARSSNELLVNEGFFDAGVSQQARLIEFALIRSDPDIPSSRAASYQRVVDQFGGLDVSTTEGPP
ncbi:MAG: hypothetical protein DLM67_03235 [Candidatus Nephthysia bennettiae]|nr:MAG: hypothetical protein DLM67_03235 [Candidatus Dormibacteraeota bacterium]